MPHISLAAEKLWTLSGFPITNSLLTTWVVMALLIIFSFAATSKLAKVPGTLQSIAELIVGGLYDFFGTVTGKHIKQLYPLLASFFLFILIANWVGLLPGVGTVGFFRHEEFVPLLRAATADLNTTVALAIIAVISMQYFGFKNLGMAYGSRFLDFRGPINFFVGFLEILSDVSKILSFAFRLFGNIFAGEVLLTVMAFLMPFIVPLPFLTMELFVGLIQALVFSMLTAVFLSIALSHGEGEHGEASHA